MRRPARCGATKTPALLATLFSLPAIHALSLPSSLRQTTPRCRLRVDLRVQSEASEGGSTLFSLPPNALYPALPSTLRETARTSACRSRVLVQSKASEGFEEPDATGFSANGCSPTSPKKPRKIRRARCVDFPSSAYRQKSQSTRSRASGRNNSNKRERVPSVNLRPRKSQTAASIFEPEFASIEESAERTRLLESRSYARSDAFLSSEICRPPTLEDLSPPDVKPFDRYWAGAPFRLSVLIAAYLFFPYLTMFLDEFVTMPPNELDEITSKFGPGISILYGTFVSLTLNILYTRQQSIQNDVSTESALLSLIQRKILTIFRDDRESVIEGSQCVADQIRTLVRGSRGVELMGIMYSDPYGRILELIEDHEYKLLTQSNDLGAQGVVLGSARDVIKDLQKARATRLSDESLALPPTHFFVLSVLTGLILLGYSISILPTVDPMGRPSNESSILFAVLCAVYVLFFASDVNQPFQGVYQIRRSSTAAHLLQTKFLIANHPLTRGEVDFDAVEEDEKTVRIRSPGLGDMKIDSSDFYPLPDEGPKILE